MKPAFAILLAVSAGPCFGVTNSITLRNTAASAVTNYPLQFARPFARGEVINYPQIGICTSSTCTAVSSWLTTQVDVKVRWDDGSVKHAILSIVVPSVPSGTSFYTFRNQPGCNCGTGASKSAMLAAAYDFDARMEFTQNGNTKVVSARSIVNDWPQTILAAPIDSTTTTLVVVSGLNFPQL